MDWRGLLRAPLHGLYQAALLGFHADEGGHDSANTELRNVSTEDRGQQRTGDGGGDFLAEVTAHKVGHRFVMSRRGLLSAPRRALARAGRPAGPAN